MDQISQVYNQMCKMSNNIQSKEQDKISIDNIILEIQRHLNEIILCLPKKQADILKFYIGMLNDNNRQLIQIFCVDQLRYKFKILLNGYQILLTVIPQSILAHISKKYKYLGGFYGGSRVQPTNQIYYVYKKIGFNKKFIEQRKKQLQLIKKQLQQMNLQNNMMHEQSIQDVFRSYICYFRSKN